MQSISVTNWTSIRAETENTKRTNASTIDTELTRLQSDAYIQGVANNNQDFITRKAASRNAVTNAVNVLSSNVTDLQTALKQLLETQKTYADEANRIRNEIQAEKTEVEKAQVLNKIRKEQAESLHKKYAGNYHSSWLGLWVPFSDEFRVGLLVTTLALFMSIFVLTGFLIYSGHIPAFWKRSTVGGSYLKKTRT